MDKIKRVLSKISTFYEVHFSAILLITMIALFCVQIFIRYVINGDTFYVLLHLDGHLLLVPPMDSEEMESMEMDMSALRFCMIFSPKEGRRCFKSLSL